MADLTRESSLVEIGLSGIKRFAGHIHEEFLPELRGARGVRVYQEMRNNDPTIGAMLRATRDTIRSVDWQVEKQGDKPIDNEAAEFLDSCRRDMSHSWQDFIAEVTTMLPFGWAFFEVVYKIRAGPNEDPPSAHNDRRIGWRKIALRAQESLYDWILDAAGGIQGMRQMAAPDFRIREIPIAKAVLFRTDREKNSPEGQSILRWAYRPWYMKKNLEEIEAIGIERDLTGLPVIMLPVGAREADRIKAQEILERLKNDETTGLILQKGQTEQQTWKFELVNSPGSKAINTDQVIQRYSGEIALAFLAQFLRLGQQRVGSYALSRDQKDFFYLSITAILDNIEETINRFLIPPLFRLNNFNGLEKLPRIVHGRVGQRNIDQFVSAIRSLADSGLLGPVDSPLIRFLRLELGLPAPSEETEPQNLSENGQSDLIEWLRR